MADKKSKIKDEFQIKDERIICQPPITKKSWEKAKKQIIKRERNKNRYGK
jgi:hypothetical protein